MGAEVGPDVNALVDGDFLVDRHAAQGDHAVHVAVDGHHLVGLVQAGDQELVPGLLGGVALEVALVAGITDVHTDVSSLACMGWLPPGIRPAEVQKLLAPERCLSILQYSRCRPKAEYLFRTISCTKRIFCRRQAAAERGQFVKMHKQKQQKPAKLPGSFGGCTGIFSRTARKRAFTPRRGCRFPPAGPTLYDPAHPYRRGPGPS